MSSRTLAHVMGNGLLIAFALWGAPWLTSMANTLFTIAAQGF